MNWDILDTGTRSAVENMQIDAQLLEGLGVRSRPLIHFYEWATDSATYGYFIQPEAFLCLDKVKERSLTLAQRSTGGGIVFHLWDMAFSVLVPSSFPQFSMNTLENYALINTAVLASVQEWIGKKGLSLSARDIDSSSPHCQYFCMAKPTKYDVVLQGRKIAGAAQRKTKDGFLHQGTISLVAPSDTYLQDVLLPGTGVAAAMKTVTHPLLGEQVTDLEIRTAKNDLRKLLAIQLNQARLKSTEQEGVYV